MFVLHDQITGVERVKPIHFEVASDRHGPFESVLENLPSQSVHAHQQPDVGTAIGSIQLQNLHHDLRIANGGGLVVPEWGNLGP